MTVAKNNSMLVEDRIKSFIAENLLFSQDGFPHGDDASFLREGTIDSLGVMELVAFVQSAFGVTVAQPEVTPANFDSVTRLAAFVRRKLASKPTPAGQLDE